MARAYWAVKIGALGATGRSRSARASELAYRSRPQGGRFAGPGAGRHLLADRRVHHHQMALRIDEDRLTVHPEQREHAPLAGEDPRLIPVAEKCGRGPRAEMRLIGAH